MIYDRINSQIKQTAGILSDREVYMMKKTVSFMLALALIMAVSISACASDFGLGYAANNVLGGSSWYDDREDDESWLEYRMEIENALLDKLLSDRDGNDALPFWSWVDLDGDGLSEIILDNSDGKRGVETVDCRLLKKWGSKNIVTKGDFTVYYWKYGASRADPLFERTVSRCIRRGRQPGKLYPLRVFSAEYRHAGGNLYSDVLGSGTGEHHRQRQLREYLYRQ